VFNHSQDGGINGTKIVASPFALSGTGNSIHVFVAGLDGAFLEFYKDSSTAWAVFNHSQDAGINGTKIAASPFALSGTGNSIHVFVSGDGGFFLEFDKDPNNAWAVFNHSQDAGINGMKVSDGQSAYMDADFSIHVFAAKRRGDNRSRSSARYRSVTKLCLTTYRLGTCSGDWNRKDVSRPITYNRPVRRLLSTICDFCGCHQAFFMVRISQSSKH
jgi:hypothetical protein